MSVNFTGTMLLLPGIGFLLAAFIFIYGVAWLLWADRYPESWIGVGWSKFCGFALTARRTLAASCMGRVLVPLWRSVTLALARTFFDRNRGRR